METATKSTGLFIRMNIQRRKPAFKDLVGIHEVNDIPFLEGFCNFIHPKNDKIIEDNKVNVFTRNSHFIYKLYNIGVLRTEVNSGFKTLYPKG